MSDGMSMVVAGGMVSAAYLFFIYIPSKKQKYINRRNSEKQMTNNAQALKNDSVDFYGTKKLIKEPDQFMKEIIEKQKIFDSGEEIAVDAAEAFYLIRNSIHHGMIVGETGLVNVKTLQSTAVDVDEIKERIINYQPSDSDAKNATFELPPHVEKVVDLSDGGVRWVFTEEHAKSCGIASVCYDKYDRVMPDPDEEKEDKKTSRRDNNSNRNEANTASIKLAVDNAKKLTAIKEMLEESRVDTMLEKSQEKEKKQPEANQKKKELIIDMIDDFHDEELINEDVMPQSVNLALEPVQFIDDTEELEDEFEMPNYEVTFEQSLDKSFESSEATNCDVYEPKELVVKTPGEVTQLAGSIEAVDGEDEEGCTPLLYESLEQFTTNLTGMIECKDKFAKKLFDDKNKSGVYLDFDEEKIYVEKNHFAATIASMFDADSEKRFNRDLIKAGDSTEIYDGIKLNDLLAKIATEFDLIGHGENAQKLLWNVLFENTEIVGMGVLGWFVKIDMYSYPEIENFIKSNSRAASVKVVANTSQDISRKKRFFKNLKQFF